MTFDEVWKGAKGISGYFSSKAARKLWQIAKTCDRGSQFVEIGSYCGRSSAVLGRVAMVRGCTLTCIDNFAFKYGMHQFLPNLHALGIEVTLMMMSSERAARIFGKYVNLLFIDGNHAGIQTDLNIWLPYLVPRGWLLVHDYGPGWPRIQEAVDALVDYEDHGCFSSLAVRRKVHEDSDSVSVK